MNKTIKMTIPVTIAFSVMWAMSVTVAAVAAEKGDPPSKTTDGLELVKQTKQRLVYARPEADLSQYTDVAILDCHVAFKKNWKKNYNRDAIDLQSRVDDNDMDRIKKRLAAEFKKIFTEELTKEGKHAVVDHVGPEVLVLRPAIINLDVTSVDTRTASRSRSFNASAGEMTLYLELYDSVTSSIVARVLDAQADRDYGTFQISNQVTNTAAADRILRGWAQELSAHLGEVKVSGE
jgi:hypothetical protein